MYPNFRELFFYLLGVDIPGLAVINTFGFFVALAFVAAAWLLGRELKRKEAMGLIFPVKRKIIVGEPASIFEVAISGLLGFVVGFKVFGLIFNMDWEHSSPQDFIISTQGNYIGGLALGALFAYFTWRDKEKTKLPTPKEETITVHPYQLVGNITVIAAISGILGAKIFHHLENWDAFMANPIGELTNFFSGLTFYGGLIVATACVLYYVNKNGIKSVHIFDATGPSLMLAYGIGRLGCQVAGDGDWGINNTSPKPGWLSWLPDGMWAYDFPHNVLREGVPLENCTRDYCTHLATPVFPTPFYEVLMALSIFILLWSIRKRITIPGMLFSIYLIFNGIERFAIESIRVNTKQHFLGMIVTQAQIISTSLFLLGVAGVIYTYMRSKRVKTT